MEFIVNNRCTHAKITADGTKKQTPSKVESPLWKSLSVFLLILVVVALNHTKMEENDTWWHVALGRWMVQNHQIYRTEIFSQIGLDLALAFLIAFRAPVRPQIFEIIFSSFLLVILNFWKDKPHWKILLGLIPVQILWANLHGSYLLGPFLMFLFATGISLGQAFPFLPVLLIP